MNRSESKPLFWLYTLLALFLLHYLAGYISIHRLIDALGADKRALPFTHKDYFIYSIRWGLGGSISLLVLAISFFLTTFFKRNQGVQESIRENLEDAPRAYALLQKNSNRKVVGLPYLKVLFYRRPIEIAWTAVLLGYFLCLVLIADLSLQKSLEPRREDITVATVAGQEIKAQRLYAFSEFYLVQGKNGSLWTIMNKGLKHISVDRSLSS